MKKQSYSMWSGMLFLILFLYAGSLFSQSYSDPFETIKNDKVLPLLKHLPRRHGGMNVPAVDGRLLYDIIIKRGYQRGLEIGTSNGYSGLWVGMAFQKTGGQVITLEIEPERAREAQNNFKKAGLDKVIDSRICDAFKEIPNIEGKFDFVFIDAWKNDYLKFLNLIRTRIKPGGVITAHNVRNARYEMADFLESIKSDPNFETTINRNSSAGVSISYKKK